MYSREWCALAVRGCQQRNFEVGVQGEVLSQQVNTEDARDKRGTNPRLRDDILAGALVKRPIILLGDVGVGKSIFLRHLFASKHLRFWTNCRVLCSRLLKHSGLINHDVPKHIVTVIAESSARTLGMELSDREFVRSSTIRKLMRSNGEFVEPLKRTIQQNFDAEKSTCSKITYQASTNMRDVHCNSCKDRVG